MRTPLERVLATAALPLLGFALAGCTVGTPSNTTNDANVNTATTNEQAAETNAAPATTVNATSEPEDTSNDAAEPANDENSPVDTGSSTAPHTNQPFPIQ